jgi:hypothetical protein
MEPLLSRTKQGNRFLENGGKIETIVLFHLLETYGRRAYLSSEKFPAGKRYAVN